MCSEVARIGIANTGTLPAFKLCPFCGSEDLEPEFSEHETECWIWCRGCLTLGPVATVGCRDDDDGPIDLEREAAELWNGRKV
jgi:hypothetical protein